MRAGLKGLFPKSSERHLANTDGYESTYYNNVNRKVAGQIERQQQTGDHGRTIVLPFLFQDELSDGPLEEDTGGHGSERNNHRA